MSLGPITVPEVYLIGFVLSVLIVGAVHLLVAHTAFGRALRASSADPQAAAVMGVDVRKVHAWTFALGAACAAMGGVLIGTAFSFTPSSGGSYLLISFAIVVLGGVGHIFGTLVAGIAMGLLQSVGAVVFGDPMSVDCNLRNAWSVRLTSSKSAIGISSSSKRLAYPFGTEILSRRHALMRSPTRL